MAHQKGLMEFFPEWSKLPLNSVNSGNLTNHINMNEAQLKDPVSPICLGGNVVAFWCLTQDVALSL